MCGINSSPSSESQASRLSLEDMSSNPCILCVSPRLGSRLFTSNVGLRNLQKWDNVPGELEVTRESSVDE